MRAENVWRLPQSLRDGWRRGFERASESHRDGWLLITSDVQRPFTFFPFSLPCLSILSGTFVHFLFPSLPSRRLVHDAHRGEVRHPHFLACFLLPLFLSLTIILSALAKPTTYECTARPRAIDEWASCTSYMIPHIHLLIETPQTNKSVT